jgi:predicted lipid-binding transport protein (Tim44 family)
LPRRDGAGEEEDRFAAIDAFTKAGTPLNDALREMTKADPAFRSEGIRQWRQDGLRDDRHGFADGDRKTLKNLLSKRRL